MYGRSWGTHYRNGAIVLTIIEDKASLVVVTEHSGDCHHHYVRVTIDNDESTPRDLDHITAHPDDEYTGYYIGMQVGQLTTSQMMSLVSGVDVPKLQINEDVASLLALLTSTRHSPQPLERTVAAQGH